MYLLDYIYITKRTTVATTSKIRVVASLTGRLFRIQNGKYKVVASLKKQLIRVVASLTKHVTSSLLNLVYLPCKQQLADIFVKELPQFIFVSLLSACICPQHLIVYCGGAFAKVIVCPYFIESYRSFFLVFIIGIRLTGPPNLIRG
jgi:hypothetical protein